jgi:hypothetical protein
MQNDMLATLRQLPIGSRQMSRDMNLGIHAEWLDGFYSQSVFKSLSAISHSLMNEILLPKSGAV